MKLIQLVVNLFSIITCSEVIVMNSYLYFDPVSEEKCNEFNYWTPFNQDTTCYRFVSLVVNDTESSETLKVMLDHNIGTSDFNNYQTVLKEKTSTWTRYTGNITIIDEDTAFSLFKFTGSKPAKGKKVSPKTKLSFFSMNNYYIINGQVTDEKGYWTSTENEDYAYAFDKDTKNTLIPKTEIYGVRPVLEINKSLLTKISPYIEIDTLTKKAEKFEYERENRTYDNYTYQQLQGFTIAKDKLVYHFSGGAGDKGVTYTVLLKDMKTFYSRTYDYTYHGNGMTYNNKTSRVLIVGPNKNKDIWQMYGLTIIHERTYTSKDGSPIINAIGYDYINDLYVGHYDKQGFMTDTEKFIKTQAIDFPYYETSQDLEFRNGYCFFVSYEGGNNRYQSYSFNKKDSAVIYVYNFKLNEDKTPTKDFGRLVCRLKLDNTKGELEGISFHDDYAMLGYSFKKGDGKVTDFYKINYEEMVEHVKK